MLSAMVDNAWSWIPTSFDTNRQFLTVDWYVLKAIPVFDTNRLSLIVDK